MKLVSGWMRQTFYLIEVCGAKRKRFHFTSPRSYEAR
jgi:hypothetical protein